MEYEPRDEPEARVEAKKIIRVIYLVYGYLFSQLSSEDQQRVEDLNGNGYAGRDGFETYREAKNLLEKLRHLEKASKEIRQT